MGEVDEDAALTGGEEGEGEVTKPVESMYTVEREEEEASAVEGDAAGEEGAASSS